MVITSIGQELARVTLIELQDIHAETFKVSHQVILDELVKPNRPVLDYVTGNSHDFGTRFLSLTSIFSLTSPS